MKYEDDLRYASEAIQAIAYDAMQRIERLYSLRFQVFESPKPEVYTSTPNFDRVELQDEDPRFQPTQSPNRSQNPKPITQVPIAQRPEKIDSNLHGLEL